MNMVRILTAFGLILLVGLTYVGNSGRAYATAEGPAPAEPGGAQIAPQTCDSDVWNAMTERARMETEREIMQNQNLIYKADSILTYTCFDRMAAHVASHVGRIFTHTTYFLNRVIIPWGDPWGTDHNMREAVRDAMETYINGNFMHALLGGRGNVGGIGLERPPVWDTFGENTTYGCGQMARVWTVAKCLNFMHNEQFAAKDGFFPFVTLAGVDGPTVNGYNADPDKREWPMACANVAADFWTDTNNHSRNDNGARTFDHHYDYGTPNRDTFEAVREMMVPNACGPAIPTGVRIILSPTAAANQNDGVCTNPGCTYNGTACAAPGAGGGGGGGRLPGPV